MRLTKEEYLREEKKFELNKKSEEQNDIIVETPVLQEAALPEVEKEPEMVVKKKPILNLNQKLPDAEIKKRLYMMADEIVSQLTIPGKTLDELENTYLMFNGQMSVVNRCRLLSFEEQQELNAKVFAIYYQKKAELKK
ncbi:MAG: hypothetical protein PWR12_1011 [Eubacteriaceae bacterium]|jgi:hypothetical protein|nr:hypothetical protein [Eubacteriaceae bacterium]MDK2904935.1 hypothetical protein [Eubacteriaceae bacterium]